MIFKTFLFESEFIAVNLPHARTILVLSAKHCKFSHVIDHEREIISPGAGNKKLGAKSGFGGPSGQPLIAKSCSNKKSYLKFFYDHENPFDDEKSHRSTPR